MDNKNEQLDENLSEELLNEDASPSKVRTSKKLNENMDSNPFKSLPNNLAVVKPLRRIEEKKSKFSNFTHSLSAKNTEQLLSTKSWAKVDEEKAARLGQKSQFKTSISQDITDLLKQVRKINDRLKGTKETQEVQKHNPEFIEVTMRNIKPSSD